MCELNLMSACFSKVKCS